MKRIAEAFYAVPHTIASRRDLTAIAQRRNAKGMA
jgi:hypothetical protein